MSAPGSIPPPPETVVARLRPHSRALFFPTVALLADIGAVAYFAGSLPEEWMNLLVLAAGALLALVLFAVPVLRWLSQNDTITTRRVVIRSGILVRSRQELLHSRGYDVTVRRTWVQSAFGSGDVRVNTGLEHPFVIRDVPKPFEVQAALDELMEEAHSLVADRRRAEQSTALDGDTIAWGGR